MDTEIIHNNRKTETRAHRKKIKLLTKTYKRNTIEAVYVVQNVFYETLKMR